MMGMIGVCVLVTTLAIMVGGPLVFVIGQRCGIAEEQERAIAAGAGRYVVNEQTGETKGAPDDTVWSEEEVSKNETPRDMALEVKLGPYMPLVDREPSLTGKPYETTFGTGPMLLGEIEFDYQFFTRFGSLGAGFSIGYAEKYGHAIDPTTGLTSTIVPCVQDVAPRGTFYAFLVQLASPVNGIVTFRGIDFP